MTMLQAGLVPSTGGGYQIERSLRFNSADSAYLNRTNGGAGSTTTGTLSLWVKRGDLGTERGIFATNVGASVPPYLRFPSDNTLRFSDGSGGTFVINTTQVFRDVSAWYHIVVACDTTQGTSSNRIKIYVNGTQVTALSTATYPGSSTTISWTAATSQFIGQNSSSASYFNGYMTEVNFIDGQQLAPSDFGETDSATGVWKPKAYSGTYGTNGFYLKFADNSGTTSTTLGKDSSGNSNNWTPNNFSVTAGAGNDSMVDSPTSYGTDTGVGGSVRGNYCTLNPLTNTWSASLTNGNLDYSFTGSSTSKSVAATIAIPTTGSWYWEATLTADENENLGIGLIKTSFAPYSYSCVGTTSNAGTGNSYGRSRSSTWNGATNTAASAWNNTSDVIQFAYDASNGKLWFGKNNTWQSGDPAAGTSPSYSSISGEFYPVVSHDSGVSRSTGCIFNFGQRAFAYTAPSGFKALCTTNLPTPTIGATSTTQAGKYFDVKTYTGDGTSPKQVVSGLTFQPDFIWSKDRNLGANHTLYDAVRGVGSNKALSSSTTDPEGLGTTAGSPATFGYISSINSDGYTTTTGSTNNNYHNANGTTYVGWVWNAGGSNATNTSGTITSTVRANTTSGFSIVTYTGNGTSGATVGHGLGVTPGMMIVKVRSTTNNWRVYHSSLGATKSLLLDTTDSVYTQTGAWNDTAPTSTVFSVGNFGSVNGSGSTHVAYCFANVEGYSRAFSYTGNGSSDGSFVYLGFRPRFILIKTSTRAGEYWVVYDTARNTYNLTDLRLFPNLSNAEGSGGTMVIDILSNGFKIRGTDTSVNSSGDTYIGFAVAESPFKYSLGR